MTEHRICPRCQGLFDIANWICPHCGAEFAAPKPRRPALVDRWLPGEGSATKLLIIWIGLAYLVQIAVSGTSIMRAINERGILLGAMVGPFVDDGEYWRLITVAFLHAGLLHVGLNLFVFWQLGRLVETTFGRAKLFVIFFFCVLTGSIAIWFFSPAPAIGASGGVVGLIGVMLVWGIRQGGAAGAMMRRVMIQNAVLILLLGLIVSNVSNSGHIGGFIGGALIAFVVSPIGFGPNRGGANRLWDVLAFGTLAVVLACLALAGWRFYEHTSEAQALEIERAVEGARATEARRIRRPIENLRHTYEREYLRAQWAQLAQSLRANADELARMASAEIEDEEVARVAREASERMRRRAEDFAAAARGEIDEPPVDDEEYERVRLLDLLVRGWIP